MAISSLEHRVLPAEAGRIDRIVQSMTNLSRARVRGLFEHGCVKLNGEPCLDSGFCATSDALVGIRYDPHHHYKERSHHRSNRFRILHEDSHLIVVEKSAGLLTVPTVRREKETLVHALDLYLQRGSKRVHAAVVHRLDRDTSGLLVFGKSDSMAQRLKSQFEDRKPVREYRAIVAGTLSKPNGSFRTFLSTDEDLNQRSTTDTAKGKLAVTHYTVLKKLRGATWVGVKLETGRRNQIRVHFAEIGHPVLGDRRYEPQLAQHPAWKHPWLALHAMRLGFTHPVTGKKLLFESPPGMEFEVFLQSQSMG